MSYLTNPHDAFFKQTFSQSEIIHNFLEEYLPPEVASALDLSTLELQKDSFIDEQLQEHFSDLLYKCLLSGEGTADAFVYLLLEHKSSPEKLTPLQLLGYMVQIWQNASHQGAANLSPIIPIVIYNGRSRWQVSEDFAGLFTGPEALSKYWPTFRYQLHDFGRLSQEEIRGLVINQIAIMVMKHIKDPQLQKVLPDILQRFLHLANRELAVEYLYTVLIYISAAGDSITEDELRNSLEVVFAEQGDEIMPTLAKKWVEEGLLEGQQRATINNILDTLMLRFDAAPPSVSEGLRKIEDVEELRQLLRRAVTAESLTDFEQYLNSL